MPSLSPRMQQLQGGMSQGPDQATALFEQGLSEMAYQLLTQRMPDLVPEVITFKVLSTDVDKGYGVGAFVVSHAGQPLYIPVVMSNNAIKPLDIMFHKALNVFLPLNKGWLDELDKSQLSPLGGGVKTPETLYTDVDIRNIVVPPITGRFSYASWHPKAAYDAGRVLSVENLEKTAEDKNADMLLPVLTAAPNTVKLAFKSMLEKHPRLLKAAAETYGVSALAAAMTPRLEKSAAKQNFGGALWVADKDTTPSEFQRIFGDKAGEAYAGVRKSGFAAKDTRLNRNMAVQEQPYERWIEPTQPGVYLLYDSTGVEKPAFVMPNPIDLFDEGTRYGRRPAIPGHNPLIDNSYYDPDPHGSSNKVYPYGRPDEGEYSIRRRWGAKPYLAVFGNGDYIEPLKLVGRDSIADAIAGNLHKRLFDDVDGAPKVGKGFFVRQKGTTFQATVPLQIKSISTDADGIRRMKATTAEGFMGDERVLCTDPKNAYGSIWMPRDSDIVYIPPDFIWVPLKEHLNERSWFQSIHDLSNCVLSMLGSVGAKKVAIKDAGARQFSVDGTRPMSRIDALKKLAHEHVLPVEDADRLLTKAADEGKATAWVASPAQLARAQMAFDKLAADDDKKKSDSGDKPKKKSPPSGGSAGGPPSAGGMDDQGLGAEAAQAAMGPPPAPPPPSPTELAAMEMDQAIQLEMQKLQDKQQMLAALVQRSHEIAGGAPPAPSVQSQAMGAPPPSQNLVTGGPPAQPGPASMMGTPNMPPTGGAMPGMDPSMAGGQPGMDPSMTGGPGGAIVGGQPSIGGDPSAMQDPSMMRGMPPSMPGMDPSMGQMDPAMAMGGQPGMDPSMQQASGAMMPVDGPNAGSLQTEVNPQFLDQAAQLHSADVFDAAAVAMLAQSPALHGVVGQYLPNLEKAVDNLARVQLTLWMQEADLKERVGEETFDGLEQGLQTTFKSMGDLVLRLARGVQGAKDPEAHASS